MARATIKNINDAIRAKYPDFDINFYKGEGYFYFTGESDLDIDSIYTFALKQAPLEDWLKWAFANIDEAIAEADIDVGGYEKDENGVIVMRPKIY